MSGKYIESIMHGATIKLNSQFPFGDERKRNGGPVTAMKAWEKVEVKLHSFLNLALESSKLSFPAPVALIPGQNSAGTR